MTARKLKAVTPDTPAVLPDEVTALFFGTMETVAKANKDAVKAIVGQHYEDGTHRHFRSPIGRRRKLGEVYRTDPEPTYVITDRAALDAHLELDPLNMEVVHQIVAPYEELLALVLEHAPMMVETTRQVCQEARDAALAAAADGEEVPGIELRKASGSVTVRPDKEAEAAFTEMINAGVITWNGTRALPPGDESA